MKVNAFAVSPAFKVGFEEPIASLADFYARKDAFSVRVGDALLEQENADDELKALRVVLRAGFGLAVAFGFPAATLLTDAEYWQRAASSCDGTLRMSSPAEWNVVEYSELELSETLIELTKFSASPFELEKARDWLSSNGYLEAAASLTPSSEQVAAQAAATIEPLEPEAPSMLLFRRLDHAFELAVTSLQVEDIEASVIEADRFAKNNRAWTKSTSRMNLLQFSRDCLTEYRKGNLGADSPVSLRVAEKMTQARCRHEGT